MFLDDVTPFDKKDWPEKERAYSNWVKIAEYIYGEATIDDVVRVLQLELLTKRREYNISRLYSRFAKLRLLAEVSNLSDFFSKFTTIKINPVFAHLSWAEIDRRTDTVDKIIMAARSEVVYGVRYYIVRRLYNKYGALRRKLEQKEMMKWKTQY